MIDFACKSFDINEVIKCGLGLTKSELSVLKWFMTNSHEWHTTEDAANNLNLNLSTIQRAVKKLHEKQVLRRSQENLDGGGYVYAYQIKSRTEIRDIMMSLVQKWTTKVAVELETWEKD